MHGGSSRSTQETIFLLLLLSYTIYGFYVGFLSIYVDSITDDKHALLSIKSRIKADPLGLLSDWKADTDPCLWKGVRCDSSGRVISLNITSSLFEFADNVHRDHVGFGTICRNHVIRTHMYLSRADDDDDKVSQEDEEGYDRLISKMKYSYNVSSPSAFCAMCFPCDDDEVFLDDDGYASRFKKKYDCSDGLNQFILSKCRLEGKLSPDIGNLTQLKVLSLPHNSFFGEIPREISSLRFLEIMNLEGNRFSGTVPSGIGKLPRLKSLNLARNYLKGNMTLDIISRSCQNLIHVHLDRNFLSGSLPSSIGKCTSLQSFTLSSNMLSGLIPPEIGELKNLRVLDISRNSFYGPIPIQLTDCYQLSFLVLTTGETGKPCISNTTLMYQKGEFNCFPTVPAFVMGLPSLKVLWAPLATYGRRALPSYWGRKLEVINLAGNSFVGTFPRTLIARCKRLIYLDLSDNELGGHLPTSLSAHCAMVFFNFSGNALIGSLPSTARISRNRSMYQLPESIPLIHWRKNCLNMLLQWLNNDLILFFSTRLYRVYCQLVSYNLPEQPYCRLLVVHDINDNDFEDSLWSIVLGNDLIKRTLIHAFFVCGNNPTGITSSTLFNSCAKSHVLVIKMSKNCLLGYLPVNAISKCISLQFFEGENNKLVENTSKEIIEIKHGIVSLLKRKLTDYTPSKGINTGSLPYTSHTVVKKSHLHHPNSITVAAITAGCAIVVLLFIFVFLFQCVKPEAARHVNHQVRKQVVTFRRFDFPLTYENVVAATGNFSVNKLIGNGGFGTTYKAELIPDLILAVKRLSLGKFQGPQQFEAEIRTLGMVDHPNLVTLIGYHASESEMFLIYNYLPGGNLESLLHDKGKGFLSWKVRYKIALDIAQALAYLHDECMPKVLHRDIKPSNVLLDNNLNAYLSDFGLARLLSASETHATTDVEGTFGYVAPEYAMTCRLSDKADVYSYGVVLLEILSGKKALDPYFSTYGHGYNIVAWACQLCQKNRPAEILAPGLWEQGPHTELLNVLKLAVKCTMASLSVRPRMRQVVDSLKSL